MEMVLQGGERGQNFYWWKISNNQNDIVRPLYCIPFSESRFDIVRHMMDTEPNNAFSKHFFPEVLTWRVSGWERGGVPRVRETESDSPSSPRSSRPLTSASSREGPTLYISATYLGLRHMSLHVPLVLLHLLISSPPQLIAASDAWPVHRPSVKTARRKTRENAQENLRRKGDVLRAGEKKGEGISQLITVTALNHYYLLDPVSLSTYVDLIMSVLKTPNLKFTWRSIPKSFWYLPWVRLTWCCFLDCKPPFVIHIPYFDWV